MPGKSNPAKKGPAKKRSASSGDRYDLSGDFRGAVVNIQSTIVSNAEVKDIEALPPEPGEPPFQGLQYFDEKDADRFFGRETVVARIVGRLATTRFLTVIGASGSGKSSVVRAGVIPALRRGERLADGSLPPTDSGKWDIRILTPSAHPLDALAVSLSREADPINAITGLRAELTQTPNALSLIARWERKWVRTSRPSSTRSWTGSRQVKAPKRSNPPCPTWEALERNKIVGDDSCPYGTAAAVPYNIFSIVSRCS
ncbi:MAG TPA: ATP-binding protein [Anaerolineales bacterium]|nr:ATP-binding protein [Anaerolineales bacterium]